MIRLRMLHRLLFAAAVCATLHTAAIVSAQDYKSGDRVTVTTWDAKFEASGKVVGTPGLGDNFTVDRVEGNWLWIASMRGYLRPADVRPYDDAMAYFTEKVHSNGDAAAYHNRGCAWLTRNELDIAIGDFTQALALSEDAATYSARAGAWLMKNELDKAIADYGDAIRLNPDDEDHRIKRADLRGSKYDYDGAYSDLAEVIRRNPTRWYAYHVRAYLHLSQRDFENAVADARICLSLDDATISNSYLGEAYLNLGRIDESLEQLTIGKDDESDYSVCFLIAQALAAKGSFQNAHAEFRRITDAADNGLRDYCKLCFARFLASCPDARFRDGSLALQLALGVNDRPDGWVDLHETRAIAQAECGQFDEAVRSQQQAIDLAQSQNMHASAIEILQSRLALYQSGQPFRQAVIDSSKALTAGASAAAVP